MTMTKLMWRGGKASQRMGETGHKAVYKAAERLLAKSNSRTPYELGTLVGSSGIRDYRGVVYIYYDTVYAVRLHENPQFNFRGGRRGKWLETTLREHAQDFVRWVGEGWRGLFDQAARLFG